VKIALFVASLRALRGFPYTSLIIFELAKASSANDCLVYEKPHQAIWLFISLG